MEVLKNKPIPNCRSPPIQSTGYAPNFVYDIGIIPRDIHAMGGILVRA